jgi:site-specific DNA-cytosine methylase
MPCLKIAGSWLSLLLGKYCPSTWPLSSDKTPSPGERLPEYPHRTHCKNNFRQPEFKPNRTVGDALDDLKNVVYEDDPVIHGRHGPPACPKENKHVSLISPPNTVMTRGKSAKVHNPDPKLVYYTLLELGALQAFPDDFRFDGTYEDQWEQIGKDVPPLFAKKLFKQVLADIKIFDAEERSDRNLQRRHDEIDL